MIPPNISGDAFKKEGTGRKSQKFKAIFDNDCNREFKVGRSRASLELLLPFVLSCVLFFSCRFSFLAFKGFIMHTLLMK